MTDREQIEEMAEYIHGNAISHDTRYMEDCRSIARDLYAAGYRKQAEGEWGFDCRYGYFCTNCGEEAEEDETTPYCPFCGAKMKGGDEQ